jgi:mono/diheme cytochrome c family protein
MSRLTTLVTALALLLALDATTLAAEDTSKAMYLKYCGACHGPKGKGDGIAGTFMRVKPADLTQIAKQNGGEFPYKRTLEVIDGRRTVRAHGDPEMPVWGEVLDDQMAGDLHRRAMVRGTLTLITDYIESIQEK